MEPTTPTDTRPYPLDEDTSPHLITALTHLIDEYGVSGVLSTIAQGWLNGGGSAVARANPIRNLQYAIGRVFDDRFRDGMTRIVIAADVPAEYGATPRDVEDLAANAVSDAYGRPAKLQVTMVSPETRLMVLD